MKSQLALLKKENSAFGGSLFTTRAGRRGHRPLATRETMHLVLRSSKAVKDWSFKKPNNEKRIREILQKFASKYGVKIHALANAGNHLHIHFRLTNRRAYKPFIRSVTSAIAMAVTGINRWTKLRDHNSQRLRFWDRRPFSRVIVGRRAYLKLRDYVRINVLEGYGLPRNQAQLIIRSGIEVNSC